ncbi:MAG: exodeoxyribonuclease VII large subunit, partial [Candidatus Neomarinimicrobiota bacterium]|nr:exodeoxyribonuclease VII large subunit [Candidatus Neomarinimicrobiota bacterium]
MSQSRSVLSVSEITVQIKGQLESQFQNIWIQGEISNFKHHSSGHMYFTVKDDSAELRCVMFRGYNQMIHFKPENGMEVLLHGKITVYEPRGQYQLMVQNMEPAGIGT